MEVSKRISKAAMISSAIDSIGTGTFVSVSTIFFSMYNNVSATTIGLGLTLSAISGILFSLPIAYLADRYGKLEIFSISYVLRAVGTVGWLFISGNTAYLTYMALFGAIDRSAASLTRSLIIAPLNRKEAVVLMGRMALPANVGYGIGAGISSVILFLKLGLPLIIITNAISFILVVYVYRRALKGLDVSSARIKKPLLMSWSVISTSVFDRNRFNLLIENLLFSFHRTLLNVYIPLVAVLYLKNMNWIAPLAVILNTVVVSLLQGRINRWAFVNHRYDKLWSLSGLLIAISFIAVIVISKSNTRIFVEVLLGMVILFQILAEMFSSASLAVYMTIFSREDLLATDLSAINLGGQLQNMLGPIIFSTTASSTNGIAAGIMVLVTAGVAMRAAMTKGKRDKGDE
ncbi:MFS transporter [Pediococcus pentosaceus]|uniref:MFS transporter n=1 Tax=Pediococcus pentosaceus TaxID=1255 RepID=UPI001F592151|nr:MFS transporter [Pediococcus pentosaceus]MCI2961482.1 MFS transporter [Pediococcus pentosaceus]MCT3020760.1 MFS transporter [Pediococcus pentosaceus]MCT3023879.1 MFS transporter [Pediococcus pentosaceus]